MVLNSIPFIFFFLPFFLLIYYIIPRQYKNFVLMFFSLVFYSWGNPIYIILLLFSTGIGFIIGRKIEKYKRSLKKRSLYFALLMITNILLLMLFKYSDFLIENLNLIFRTSIPLLKIAFPIGISFYTLQSISYGYDVYRGEIKAETNFINYLTCISLFPKIFVGPFMKYYKVNSELKKKKPTFTTFSDGLLRFLRGLFKKVLIAGNIGYLFTIISGLSNNQMSILTAWLGIIAFAFSIYFELSGYCDMGIGISKMLGFNIPENFDYPYTSKSITEFWKRWFITLGDYFREYVYIPLGGSRKTKLINIKNIFVVWLLIGLWHGASYNFIIFGIYYGIILLLEKFILNKYTYKFRNVEKHIYTMFIVLIGWVIIAFNDLSSVGNYLKLMFDFFHIKLLDSTFIYYFKNYFILLLIAFVFSTPIFYKIKEVFKTFKFQTMLLVFVLIGYITLFIVSISFLVNNAYNPFLYFRF